MKSLYVRMCAVFCSVVVASSVLAFLMSNLYYQVNVKSRNDAKLTRMALEVSRFGESHAGELDSYLRTTAALGYKIYLTDGSGENRFYGQPFRENDLPEAEVEAVLAGGIYHGIADFPREAFVTGFFDNELRNTVGVPLGYQGRSYALFLRPDPVTQFGELRGFFAMIIALTLLLSLVFLLITVLHVVRPIVRLTEAARTIARGRYDIRLNTRRRDELGDLARSFTAMSRELERTNRSRQEFVANVSHEIESPLTSIQGFAHTLRDDGLAPEKRREYLAIIEEESRRLSLLSKQLLTLSALDDDPSRLELSRFNLRDQFRQLARMLEWRLSDRQLALRLSVPDLDTDGDANLLHQVWMNLLSNAIKHTPPGGEITVSAASAKGGGCTVEIRDTGEGIPAERLPLIFDRFYKADEARTREAGGSGLGLAIVRKIVEVHGGSVEVSSQPGQGTVFTVHLPSRHL
ncbi:sensor histidine kinase [Paenibacillus glufosinatiresistens]|uniref:sensor histidine kinase n=1 Tax=Paenibacillus glufosinatiresistens TaxID=3070657 RepID=UPI00286E51D5|nr:HAMP domain-containing sensor histidine kinase [Paenibacillus sp. YX.27]